MRPRTLLALTLLVAGLGAFVFFYEKDLPSTEERAQLAKKVLRIDEEDAVESILIEWGGREVRLERKRAKGAEAAGSEEGGGDAHPAGWRITAPIQARADADAARALVSSLADLESSRKLEDFDRAELGLDEPRARVTLVSASAQSVLEIGAELPASSDMVVAVAGGRAAYRVPAGLFEKLTKEPGDWRDKKLFTASRGEVERVTLAGGGDKVLLARRGESFWIESPVADLADDSHVSSLTSALTGLEAKRFLDEPLPAPEDMGLAPPRGVVEAVLAGEETPFRLELGAAVDDGGEVVYGRADGQLFEVSTELRAALARSAADWRSRSWTTLQVFKIESARFEDSSGTVAVRRDGADWRRGEERVAYSAVSDVLYAISELKGDSVEERAAAAALGHDFEQPELSIQLTTQDGEEELALFPARDGLAAATADGRDAVLLVAEERLSEIREKLEELKAAEPLPEEDAEPATDAEEAADTEQGADPG